MAVASDKSRFYLENSVPELQELYRKQIFTKQELSCVVRKRSDFEHKINGRGSSASDYTRYAAFEINLESLRQKRAKRLGIKTIRSSGQRNIFFVLERATRKFHGDIGLWMQYVSFARRLRSDKKVSEILTQMLRLFPTDSQIWIYAANYALDVRGDMREARIYMQKGLRLCKRSDAMWIEYARLELIQIAKLAARRRILGLDEAGKQRDESTENDQNAHDILDKLIVTAKDAGNQAAKHVAPDVRALEDAHSGLDKMGAIPMTIFDAALQESKNRCHTSWAFFDMVAEIEVAPRSAILNHIMVNMQSTAPGHVETLIRSIKQPVIGVNPSSSEYPMCLATSLDRYHDAFDKVETTLCHKRFHEYMEVWMLEMLQVKGLDNEICKVLRAMLRKTQNELRAAET